MKTKKVEFYIDLWRGWQDSDHEHLYLQRNALYNKLPDTKRVKVIVELPTFGGTAETDYTVEASSEIQETGLKS